MKLFRLRAYLSLHVVEVIVLIAALAFVASGAGGRGRLVDQYAPAGVRAEFPNR